MNNDPDRKLITDAIRAVEAIIPDDHGIILIVLPLDPNDKCVKFASTLQRAEAMEILKQFMYYCGEDEAWMRHLT